MKKSQELIWRDAICEQAVFYLACAPRTRVGEDYPWILEYGSRHAGFNRIKKRLRQFEKRIKRFVKKTESTSPIEWFGRTYSVLYEVRNLFVDELSRILFDHVLLLRLVGFEKYFFSWRSFSSLAEVKNIKPFVLEGFPSDYMGIPLQVHDFELTQEGKKPNDRRLVANSFFFSLLNNYHQYLIKRTEADFWPSAGMSVYDCGACIGDMSLVFADLVGPSGRVHVFDPVPLHIRFCAYQAELNTDLKSVLSLNELGVAKESSTDLAPGKCIPYWVLIR